LLFAFLDCEEIMSGKKLLSLCASFLVVLLCAGTCGASSTSSPLTAAEVQQDKRTAELGRPRELCNYGRRLEDGCGVAVDLSEAALCHKLAADQGHPNAQACYGICLATGTGVPMDKFESIRCLESAAYKRNPMAVRFIKSEADKGDPDWQFLHALRLYHAGDRVESLKYFQLAFAQGHQKAGDWIRRIID
jgi:TPR repeat protein